MAVVSVSLFATVVDVGSTPFAVGAAVAAAVVATVAAAVVATVGVATTVVVVATVVATVVDAGLHPSVLGFVAQYAAWVTPAAQDMQLAVWALQHTTGALHCLLHFSSPVRVHAFFVTLHLVSVADSRVWVLQPS